MQQRGVVDHLTDSVSLLLPSFQRRQSQPSAIMSRLPHKVQVDVAKCDACHTEWRSMLPNATPATQTAAASTAPNRNQARHQSQPRAISATAGHTKWRSMSPSAMPATQTAAASTAPNRNQARHQSQPRAISATAGHTKWRSMSPRAMPATQTAAACTATNGNQARRQSHQVPHLPHRIGVDVSTCHACHTNSRGVHGDKRGPSVPPEPPQSQKCPPSAMPATQNWRSMVVLPSAAPATQTAAASRATNGNQAPKRRSMPPSAKGVRELCVCVTELCVSKLCVRELCVWERVVCERVVCVCE